MSDASKDKFNAKGVPQGAPFGFSQPDSEAEGNAARLAASQPRGNASGVVFWRKKGCFGGRNELER
jgi:hypothetical protein